MGFKNHDEDVLCDLCGRIALSGSSGVRTPEDSQGMSLRDKSCKCLRNKRSDMTGIAAGRFAKKEGHKCLLLQWCALHSEITTSLLPPIRRNMRDMKSSHSLASAGNQDAEQPGIGRTTHSTLNRLCDTLRTSTFSQSTHGFEGSYPGRTETVLRRGASLEASSLGCSRRTYTTCSAMSSQQVRPEALQSKAYRCASVGTFLHSTAKADY